MTTSRNSKKANKKKGNPTNRHVNVRRATNFREQLAARRNNKSKTAPTETPIVPKAPVVKPLTEIEQKFADYAQLVEDEAVLKETRTELRTYFTNLVLAAEDDGEDGAKVYNADETVYFSLKKVREFIFSDELQVKENQLKKDKDDLKNKQESEIINDIAKIKNIKRTLQYITPKKAGKK